MEEFLQFALVMFEAHIKHIPAAYQGPIHEFHPLAPVKFRVNIQQR